MIYHKVGVVTFPILHFHFSDSLCVCVCVYFDFEPLMYDNLFSLEGDIICYFPLFSNINSVIQPMPVNIQHGLLICRSCLGLLDNNYIRQEGSLYQQGLREKCCKTEQDYFEAPESGGDFSQN